MSAHPAKVLISACLLGEPVRHDGRDKWCADDVLHRWRKEGRVVGFCPELAGGLSVPRPPAEIEGGQGGSAVLTGLAHVRTNLGADVSTEFIAGAQQALALAHRHHIRMAVLKESSPSCGSSRIYDGQFNGTAVTGSGVTTALLRAHGIQVFSELELAEAEVFLRALDSASH
ncbi:MAG: DUF523 domain-containing protein [Ahniella sp.]|nr:DUF523 domain-containing protein [Ahniella sp.]